MRGSIIVCMLLLASVSKATQHLYFTIDKAHGCPTSTLHLNSVSGSMCQRITFLSHSHTFQMYELSVESLPKFSAIMLQYQPGLRKLREELGKKAVKLETIVAPNSLEIYNGIKACLKTQHNLTPTVYTVSDLASVESAFNNIEQKSGPKTIQIINVVPKNTGRRVLEAEAEGVEVTADYNSQKIYASSDGIMAAFLGLFMLFVMYAGLACMMNVQCPAAFPTEEFKKGREM